MGKTSSSIVSSILAKPMKTLMTRLMYIALLIAFLVIGYLLGQLNSTSAGTNKVASTNDQQAGTVAPQQAPPSGPVTVSVDDDPVLGEENAPITIIEFSDYECPFCKRSFDQMLPQLTEEYIDTGKVKLVYRDLPLPFHDPMATREAIAANCSREQGGDSTYFKYHDEIFTRTISNGNGLAEEDLTTIASDIGLNLADFSTCLDSGKYDEEIQNDLADASIVGATGTPTYFIGKSSSDGNIVGQIIVGAQPFSVFKAIIDQELEG